MNLEKEVDKYYAEQAKLNEKSRKLIDYFNQKYTKKEVTSIVQYLLENSADVYEEEIKKFKEHYESKNRGDFSPKDIKTFLTLFKVYKNQMKEPTNEKLENKQTKNRNAEGKNE